MRPRKRKFKMEEGIHMEKSLKQSLLATVAIILVVLCFMSGCSKQFMYSHVVVDINDHYVYIDSAGHDWAGNLEDAKVVEIGGKTLVCTNMIMYESKPDPKCYEYTAEEFAAHVCGPDADWRCPHSGHEPIE